MKIICVGKNYADHIKEMNAIQLWDTTNPKEPVLFLKPQTAIINKGQPFFIPSFSNEIHYELEVIIKINRLGRFIEKKFSHKYYDEIGLGIDFTARDIQENCKKNGLPWEIAKAFDNSTVLSQDFLEIKELDLNNINFSLLKNNIEVQKGNSADMIFSFNEIIAYISNFMTLKIGDLIFTGTPSGVGKVEIDDVLIGNIADKQMFKVKIK